MLALCCRNASEKRFKRSLSTSREKLNEAINIKTNSSSRGIHKLIFFMFLRRLLLLLFEVDKISLDSQKLKKLFPVILKKSNFLYLNKF